VDYILMMWWGVQTASDLDQLSIQPRDDAPGRAGAAEALDYAGPVVTPAQVQWRCLLAAAPACLPALVAFLALVPWPSFITHDPQKLAVIERVLRPVGLVGFVAALFIGYLALKRVRLGPPVWSLLLLVPFLHWFAMHRLVRHFHTRLNECRQAQGFAANDGPSLALPIADVTWVFAMLPWAILVVVGMSRTPGLSWRDGVAPCGAILTAIFAVADVATLEGLQRQLAVLLKNLGRPPAPRP
jgi:hypothetical protein